MKTHCVKGMLITALGLSLAACQQIPSENPKVKEEIIEEKVPVEEKVELETMSYDDFLKVNKQDYLGPDSLKAVVYLTRLDEEITVRGFFNDYCEVIQKLQLSKEKNTDIILDKPFEIQFVFEEQKEIRFKFLTDGQVLVNDEGMYLMDESDITEILAVDQYDHFLEIEHLRLGSRMPKSEEIESIQIDYHHYMDDKGIVLTNPDSIENVMDQLEKQFVYEISEEDKPSAVGVGGPSTAWVIQLKNGETINYESNPPTILSNGEAHYYKYVHAEQDIDYFSYLKPFGFVAPTFKINDTVFEGEISSYQYHGDSVIDRSREFMKDEILTFKEGELRLTFDTSYNVNVYEEKQDGFKALEVDGSQVMLPNEVGEHLIVIDLSDDNDNVITFKKLIDVSALPAWFNDIEKMNESNAVVIKDGVEIKAERFYVVEWLKELKLSSEKTQNSVEIVENFELIIENSTEKVKFVVNQDGIFMDGTALYPTIDCTIQSADFMSY